jgi:uncharacterized OsmC-like protein
LRCNPDLARFIFRARNRWLEGPRSQSRIQSLHGAGGEQRALSEGFVLESDSAPVMFGEDRAAGPQEYLLHALVSCLTSALVSHAAARGIRLDGVETMAEAELDFAGVLDESLPAQPPLRRIEAEMRVASAAPGDQLQALFAAVRACCPVLGALAAPVNLRFSVQA